MCEFWCERRVVFEAKKAITKPGMMRSKCILCTNNKRITKLKARIFFRLFASNTKMHTHTHTQYKESVHNLRCVLLARWNFESDLWLVVQQYQRKMRIRDTWNLVLCERIFWSCERERSFKHSGMSQLGIIMPNHIIYFIVLPTIYDAQPQSCLFCAISLQFCQESWYTILFLYAVPSNISKTKVSELIYAIYCLFFIPGFCQVWQKYICFFFFFLSKAVYAPDEVKHLWLNKKKFFIPKSVSSINRIEVSFYRELQIL